MTELYVTLIIHFLNDITFEVVYFIDIGKGEYS
jgi:hypothetical protein